MEKDINGKIDELASIVKENTSSIDELAMLVKSGFDHVGEEMHALRTELKNDIAGVDARMSSIRTELKGEIVSVRTELKNEISSEMSSVRTEISALRNEMHDGFMKTNDKVDLLAVKLQDKNIITKTDAKEVMAINPVPLA